jgi:NAD(P)-dependent dehydrogenase (short-subunit alcohol dehydrogenase family)
MKSILTFSARGGYGIGRSIAEAFALASASSIAISGRTESRLKSAVTELQATYPHTHFSYFVADVTDATAIKAMFDSFRDPDILINNAGFMTKPENLKTVDIKAWWEAFEVNVLGTAQVTQSYLRAKSPEKEGVVVTLNTMGAHMGGIPKLSSYGGSKAALLRLNEMFQAEEPEVSFISVHPGAVATDMATKSELTGIPLTDAALAANFILWVTSLEVDFLKGRFVWVNWDVDELKAKKNEILQQNLLQYTLGGFM